MANTATLAATTAAAPASAGAANGSGDKSATNSFTDALQQCVQATGENDDGGIVESPAALAAGQLASADARAQALAESMAQQQCNLPEAAQQSVDLLAEVLGEAGTATAKLNEGDAPSDTTPSATSTAADSSGTVLPFLPFQWLTVSADSGPRATAGQDSSTPDSVATTVGDAGADAAVPALDAQRQRSASDANMAVANMLELAAREQLQKSGDGVASRSTQGLEAQQASARRTAEATQDGLNAVGPNANNQWIQDASQLHRAAAQPSPTRSLDASVGSRAWQDQLGTQLSWMIDRGEQSATLRMSPEHLGPVEVRIALRESDATVWFGAAHADTRHALELSLPRLRDMLAGQGIALSQSGVFSETPRQQPRAGMGFGTGRNSTDIGEVAASPSIRRAGLGLVDLYA